MNQKEYIQQGEEYILKIIQPVSGGFGKKEKGFFLYDVEGKKYLDFGAGIAVFALGYGNKDYNDELKEQIDRLIHTSNLFYNVPAVEAAKKIRRSFQNEKSIFHQQRNRSH